MAIPDTKRDTFVPDTPRLMEPIPALRVVTVVRKVGPSGGTTMSDGLLNIDSTRIAPHVSLSWGHHSDRAAEMPAGNLRTAVGWMPLVVIFAAAGWLLVLNHSRHRGPSLPTHLAAAVSAKSAPAPTVGLAKEPAFDPATSEAIVPQQPAPVDRLKIASQSWRRGGLGSNAFVTMTLRNDNGYAVKDIDISCAFLRPDGSHLTDRSRLITDVVNLKSRKTFVRLHVGFVNVNAVRAKCSLVAARHV